MSTEPERPGGLREEWMALIFVGLIILAALGLGLMTLFG
jgi:hypothetical protein